MLASFPSHSRFSGCSNASQLISAYTPERASLRCTHSTLWSFAIPETVQFFFLLLFFSPDVHLPSSFHSIPSYRETKYSGRHTDVFRENKYADAWDAPLHTQKKLTVIVDDWKFPSIGKKLGRQLQRTQGLCEHPRILGSPRHALKCMLVMKSRSSAQDNFWSKSWPKDVSLESVSE